MEKKTLREMLKDIEDHNYSSMTHISTLVMQNYLMVIARKDKEIAELKEEIERIKR